MTTTTTTTTGTMSKALKALTTKARSALTRETSARFALAKVLSEVKAKDMAKGYLSLKALKDLGNGETAFSAWYSAELGLTTAEVSVLTQWVETTNATGETLTIGVSKALASTPERHGKTSAENMAAAHANAKTSGKVTQASVRKARKDLKLEVGTMKAKAKKATTMTEPTVAPPEKVTVGKALNLLIMALKDNPAPTLGKTEKANALAIAKALTALAN